MVVTPPRNTGTSDAIGRDTFLSNLSETVMFSVKEENTKTNPESKVVCLDALYCSGEVNTPIRIRVS